MIPTPGAGISAVIFDLGGVVLDSPLDEIARFEVEMRLPTGLINRTVHHAGASGAWARHERGELDRASFLDAFAAELIVGPFGGMDLSGGIDVASLMGRIDQSIAPRPEMIRAIRRLRAERIQVAAMTNNWVRFPEDGLRGEFDVFVESVVEGVRKPEMEIYRRCIDRLGVEPTRVAMLDDLGPNLKPARFLGVTTIKVTGIDQALGALGEVTGVALTGGPTDQSSF